LKAEMRTKVEVEAQEEKRKAAKRGHHCRSKV
jgi:hypothetical protein